MQKQAKKFLFLWYLGAKQQTEIEKNLKVHNTHGIIKKKEKKQEII